MSKAKESVNSTRVPLDPPPTLEKALFQLEQAIGGRDRMVESLQLIPELTAEQTTVLYQLADPANAKRSLAWICGNAGITVGRLLELFTKGDFAAAYVKAIRNVYKMMPAVAEDAMARALPKFKFCEACRGEGKTSSRQKVLDENDQPVNPVQWEKVTRTCLPCEGIGRVEVEPDIERQKVALQMSGLLKSGGGITVQQNHNSMHVGAVNLLKSTPDFRTATDKLLYPARALSQLPPGTAPETFIAEADDGKVVEAEVVQPEINPAENQ